VPGVSYGDLLSLLQGGSGGGGATNDFNAGGGGGGGAGAIELGAIGTLSLTSTVTANGGVGGDANYDGGGGAGGAILLHAGSYTLTSLSARGGNGGGALGGGAGGGRTAVLGGTLSATEVGLFPLINGGNGFEPGIAGVVTIMPDLFIVPTFAVTLIGVTPGQGFRTDPRYEVLPKSILVENDALADLVSTIRVESVTLTGTGTLRLDDHDLVIDYTEGNSSLATIRGYIIAGRNGGNWQGSGITSFLAGADPTHKSLGYGEASVVLGAGGGTFSGIAVDATAVLVKFTYLGDTDLDGDVDVADLGNLASNWQTAGAWTDGDFDYSGSIDVNDLGLLATNWQAGVGNPLGPSLQEALVAVGLPTTVPEPGAAMALLGLTFLAGAPRSRKRPR
jgi:hypothetical protein